MTRWMTCNITSVSTIFQSFQDSICLDDNERLCATAPPISKKTLDPG